MRFLIRKDEARAATEGRYLHFAVCHLLGSAHREGIMYAPRRARVAVVLVVMGCETDDRTPEPIG